MSQGWGDGGDSRADEPGYGGRVAGAPQGDVYDWYRRGLDLLKRRNPAAAAELLERAAAAEPASRSITEALGRAQFDTGRYEAAADSFRRIVESSPSDDYARSSLRNFLIKTYGEESFPRPADMRAELALTLTLIAARLGIDWTPPEP